VSSFRPRAEVAALLVLTLAIGSLFAWRTVIRGRPAPSPSTEEAFASVDEQLACLKRVTEEAFGKEFQDLAEAPGSAGSAAEEPAHLEDIAAKVEEVRGLAFERPPEPTYLPIDELAERAAGYAEDYPDAEAEVDSALLSSLGAVPEGSDVKELTATALSEEVAGFYDTKTKEIVVPGNPESGLDSFDELTLAHELEHALADQTLGLPIKEDFPPQGAEDSVLAATALVEGDATLTMSLYSIEGSFIGPAAILATELGGDTGLTRLPHYLQRSMIFPYIEGLSFVCRIYSSGGWGAVNEAYSDPPSTTAQIVFPERYSSGEEPIDPVDSRSPGARWKRTDVQALGAADLLFLFEAPGDDTEKALEEPVERAAAWGGGEVQLWSPPGGLPTATAILLVQREGERGLCNSLRDWYRAAFPDASSAPLLPGERMATSVPTEGASLRCVGDQIRLGIGPDLPSARRLVGG
jgi:hypothetical protein